MSLSFIHEITHENLTYENEPPFESTNFSWLWVGHLTKKNCYRLPFREFFEHFMRLSLFRLRLDKTPILVLSKVKKTEKIWEQKQVFSCTCWKAEIWSTFSGRFQPHIWAVSRLAESNKSWYWLTWTLRRHCFLWIKFSSRTWLLKSWKPIAVFPVTHFCLSKQSTLPGKLSSYQATSLSFHVRQKSFLVLNFRIVYKLQYWV